MFKVLSLIPATASLLLFYYHAKPMGDGESMGSVIMLFILLPLSMIWFPESFSKNTSWVVGRLSKDYTWLVVLLGWVLLLTLLLVTLFGTFSYL